MSHRKSPIYVLREFSRPMRDYWGRKLPRPIRIGRFGRALEGLTYDTQSGLDFLAALEKSADISGQRVKKVTVDLYQEGLYQWVFHMAVSAPGQKRRLCMVVAKNFGKYSKIAHREWSLLKVLHKRNPARVVRPSGSSAVTVPEERFDGALFVYFSEWLGSSYTELGIDAKHRFALVGQEEAKVLAPVQCEAIRGEILEILASLYEWKSGSALVDVEVNSGDFMGRVRDGSLKVKLIAVRNLRSGLSGAGLLRNLFKPHGEHAGKPAFLAPADPRQAAGRLAAGLTHAFGDDAEAMRFLRGAFDTLRRKRQPCPAPFYSWQTLRKNVGL